MSHGAEVFLTSCELEQILFKPLTDGETITPPLLLHQWGQTLCTPLSESMGKGQWQRLEVDGRLVEVADLF